MSGYMVQRAKQISLRSLLRESGYKYQEFTKKEQDCISRKISANIAEGKPQQQAIAIAISQCAPGKVRKQATAEDGVKVDPKPDLPGGNFHATENEDGSWNILDVPIFAEHSVAIMGRGMEPQEIRVSRNWMLKAMQKAVHRFMEDDYLPPLHVHHHGMGNETKPAGFFKLRRLKKNTYEGRNLWTLFADLVNVPKDVYGMIRQAKLPYRSVEIHDIAKPEIDSLALLDDEVPFFRFNLLTIGNEKNFGDEAEIGPIEKSAANGEPMRMYQNIGSGLRVLQYMGTFSEENMPDKTVKFVDDEEKKEIREEKEEKMVNGDDEKAKMVISRLQGVLDSLMAVMEALKGEEMMEEKEEAPAPAEMSADSIITKNDNGATADYSTKSSNGSNDVEKLQGQIDAMKFERDLERKVMLSTRDLVSYGLDESSTQKKLMEIGKKRGLQGIDVYTDAIKENMEKDPGGSWTNDASAESGTDKDLVKYASQGQSVYEKAVKYGREFDELVTKWGMRFSYSKEQFIDDQLQSEGFSIPQKQEG